MRTVYDQSNIMFSAREFSFQMKKQCSSKMLSAGILSSSDGVNRCYEAIISFRLPVIDFIMEVMTPWQAFAGFVPSSRKQVYTQA